MPLDSLAHALTDEAGIPPLPRTIAETGLGADQIEQLMVKTLHTGELSGIALAERICLPYSLLESLIERLRAERLIEVRGATGSGTAGYRYALTDLGRDRARQYLDINRYTGPAPVSLASYVAKMDATRDARGFIDRERLKQGFAHLVVPDQLFDQRPEIDGLEPGPGKLRIRPRSLADIADQAVKPENIGPGNLE